MAMQSLKIRNYFFVLIYCMIFVQLSVQQQDPPPQQPQQRTYAAAVSEFMLGTGSDPDLITEIQTRNMVRFILSNETQNADILVYPEGGLNTAHNSIDVPTPEEHITPCDTNSTYSYVLRNISCAAKQVQKYVVVNLYMKANCSQEAQVTNDTRPCTRPKENINVYSATVVFSRNGTIISRYRKTNIFNETEIRAPAVPETISFETDFGIRFGLLTSMDIFFKNPASRLLEQGVRHFILPSMWTPELPFLTANQIQLAWSFANNVTLLASGISDPTRGYTGSGIYSGSIGALTVVMAETYLVKVLQANLTYFPGVPRGEDSKTEQTTYYHMERKFRLSSENLDEYGVEILPFDKNVTQVGRHCHGSFCCAFNVQTTDLGAVENTVFYRYAIVYYNGTREHSNLPNIYTGVTACAVVACTGDDRSTCNTRFNRNSPNLNNRYRFNQLELSVVYPQSIYNRSTVMPSTLTRAMLPFTLNTFNYAEEQTTINNESSVLVSMALQQPNANFLTFGIYGRDYELDHTGGAEKVLTGILLITFGVILNIIYLINW